MKILPINFFQTCQETKSPNRTHAKKSGNKVSNLVRGKISKNSGSKFWKSYSWKSCIFLGDVQPKMCGINFPKNKQSCYQLLSNTSKVVISCNRVKTSKNRVVIKNNQSCYQLLSVGCFWKNLKISTKKMCGRDLRFPIFVYGISQNIFGQTCLGDIYQKMQFPKDFVCKHCCEIPPKRTLGKFPGKQIPKHVFEKACPTRLLPPTSDRFLRKDFTNIPWRYLPQNNFHIPRKGFYLTHISVRYFLKHVFYIFFPK